MAELTPEARGGISMVACDAMRNSVTTMAMKD